MASHLASAPAARPRERTSWLAPHRFSSWNPAPLVVRPARPKASGAPLSDEILQLVSHLHPSNANYRVVNGQLIPKCQLSMRRQRLAKLYPQQLTSLLDVGCAQGYFVLEAAQMPTCERAMGIDVAPFYIDACRQVADHIGCDAAFAVEKLDRLADRCHAWHAPFQTVLLINTYQYLFFGSSLDAGHYATHREIFGHLRRLCSERLIFNNRTEYSDCQSEVRALDTEGRGKLYTTAAIQAAASEFFHITEHGRLGRYPLWTLDPR